MKQHFFDCLKKAGLEAYMEVYNNFGNMLEYYEKRSREQTFDMDFHDSEKFTPLHYAC